MPVMTKTPLTSLAYDQKVSENLTKWPKITSKRKNNAKKRPRMAKKGQKTAWTMPENRNLRPPFRCYTEAHLEIRGGTLPSVACSLRSRGAPLDFSVGFGNIFLLPSCLGGLRQHLMAFHDPSKVWLTAHPLPYFCSRLTMIQGIIPL